MLLVVLVEVQQRPILAQRDHDRLPAVALVVAEDRIRNLHPISHREMLGRRRRRLGLLSLALLLPRKERRTPGCQRPQNSQF